MIEFTKLAEKRLFQPHETILSRNQRVDHFFMIRKGQVEVVLKRRDDKEIVLSRLGAGEFFGEAELAREGKSIANVRAGDQTVEALALPRADYLRVMKESPLTAEAVGQVVQKRLDAHRIADRRSGR